MLRTLVDSTKKAYPQALQGTGETETMGKTMLAYQFVAGLLPNIRAKVAGTEGTFEQLWVKARYEEAKARDLEPKSTVGYPPIIRLHLGSFFCFSARSPMITGDPVSMHQGSHRLPFQIEFHSPMLAPCPFTLAAKYAWLLSFDSKLPQHQVSSPSQ